MDKKTFAKLLVDGWDGGNFVARHQTGRFTGGALSGRTVANEESKGHRVPGRVKVGKTIAYPVESFAAWIADRMLKQAEA